MLKRIDLSQVIFFVAGIIETLLVFRIVMSLVAANPEIDFVEAIYDLSHPLIVHFEDMFSPIGRLDTAALVAALIYTAAAYLLAHLADKWQN